jgi:hypothetical protein
MESKKDIIVIIIFSLIIYIIEIIIIGMSINNLIIAFTISTGLTPFNVCIVDWLYKKVKKRC